MTDLIKAPLADHPGIRKRGTRFDKCPEASIAKVQQQMNAGVAFSSNGKDVIRLLVDCQVQPSTWKSPNDRNFT